MIYDHVVEISQNVKKGVVALWWEEHGGGWCLVTQGGLRVRDRRLWDESVHT